MEQSSHTFQANFTIHLSIQWHFITHQNNTDSGFMHFTGTTERITALARLYYGYKMFIFSPTTINS